MRDVPPIKTILSDSANHNRNNGAVRKQTRPWHSYQHKFAQVWGQREVTARLGITYVNWMGIDSRPKITATRREELAIIPGSWPELITPATIV